MATINKKLIHFNTKSAFDNALANNLLNDWSIVFIKETKEIWTHGLLYSCSYPLSDLDNIIKDICGYYIQHVLIYLEDDAEDNPIYTLRCDNVLIASGQSGEPILVPTISLYALDNFLDGTTFLLINKHITRLTSTSLNVNITITLGTVSGLKIIEEPIMTLELSTNKATTYFVGNCGYEDEKLDLGGKKLLDLSSGFIYFNSLGSYSYTLSPVTYNVSGTMYTTTHFNRSIAGMVDYVTNTLATSTTNGLMSNLDKATLDTLSSHISDVNGDVEIKANDNVITPATASIYVDQGLAFMTATGGEVSVSNGKAMISGKSLTSTTIPATLELSENKIEFTKVHPLIESSAVENYDNTKNLLCTMKNVLLKFNNFTAIRSTSDPNDTSLKVGKIYNEVDVEYGNGKNINIVVYPDEGVDIAEHTPELGSARIELDRFGQVNITTKSDTGSSRTSLQSDRIVLISLDARYNPNKFSSSQNIINRKFFDNRTIYRCILDIKSCANSLEWENTIKPGQGVAFNPGDVILTICYIEDSATYQVMFGEVDNQSNYTETVIPSNKYYIFTSDVYDLLNTTDTNGNSIEANNIYVINISDTLITYSLITISSSDRDKLNSALNEYVGRFQSDSTYGEIFNSYYTGSNKDSNNLGNNRATGLRSHAEGGETQAIGQYSHAEGMQTVAEGFEGHAEGYKTKANGMVSHAEGWNTEANGDRSHTEGEQTTTTNLWEHAQGLMNVSNTGTSMSQKTLHSVGIGMAKEPYTNRNAHEIMCNGDHYVYGIGGYDGTNYAEAQTLQEFVNGCYTNCGLGYIENENGIEIMLSGTDVEHTVTIPIATHSDPGLVTGEEKLCIENSLQALNSNYSNFTSLDTSADLAAVIAKCNQILACLRLMSTV